jgi:hypothetical protein
MIYLLLDDDNSSYKDLRLKIAYKEQEKAQKAAELEEI